MTGIAKLLAVTPLIWRVFPTFTDWPVVLNVATSAAMFVPGGSGTYIDVPKIVPLVPNIEYEVISFDRGSSLIPIGECGVTSAAYAILSTAKRNGVIQINAIPIRYFINIRMSITSEDSDKNIQYLTTSDKQCVVTQAFYCLAYIELD
jgi:hypothetical protein